MTTSDLFPVGDFVPGETLERLFGKRMNTQERMLAKVHLRAQWTGEKRTPKAGEWFLSGAEVTAYRTQNDLSTPYHIARIVRVKTETVVITKVIS